MQSPSKSLINPQAGSMGGFSTYICARLARFDTSQLPSGALAAFHTSRTWWGWLTARGPFRSPCAPSIAPIQQPRLRGQLSAEFRRPSISISALSEAGDLPSTPNIHASCSMYSAVSGGYFFPAAAANSGRCVCLFSFSRAMPIHTHSQR